MHVLTGADLAGVAEEKQLSPAVHVVYQGARVEEARSDGKAARFAQTWLTVVSVRNTKALKAGDAARGGAGRLAHQVLLALMGFKAPSAAGPLVPVSGPAARYSGGHQYLPLAFSAEVVVKQPT
ncbi:phage tail terminator protein [Hydrogenophaga defluvii]|uniref:DUF3168 domain-containing protein n=1 Tax=Hydrogenophaga defluvii TaxID=249410 RepID=A0ABW2S8G0_9BURK